MVRQPFERKSLWHLSAPCYHIHISMGDNFETACTALRTNVLAEACKDEKSFCFQSLRVVVCLSKAPTARVKGCPGSGGHRRPSPPKRQQLGRKGSCFLAGERFVQMWAGLAPSIISSSLVPCWKSYNCAHRRLSSVGRQNQGLYKRSTNGSKFQTYKDSAILCSHFCF